MAAVLKRQRTEFTLDHSVADLEDLFKEDIHKRRKSSDGPRICQDKDGKSDEYHPPTPKSLFAKPHARSASLKHENNYTYQPQPHPQPQPQPARSPALIQHIEPLHRFTRPRDQTTRDYDSLFHVTNISMMRADIKCRIDLYAYDLVPSTVSFRKDSEGCHHDGEFTSTLEAIMMSQK